MDNQLANIIGSTAWPAVALVIALVYRRAIVGLFSRTTTAKIHSKGIELILDSMERQGQLPFGARTELLGLTSHDIWALHDLGNAVVQTKVAKMNVAQKVAARTLIYNALLVIEGSDKERTVKVTPLGTKMLESAASLL